MPRYLRFLLVVGALLVSSFQPRAQVNVSLTPACDDAGVLAWGAFMGGATSPKSFRTDCTGAVPLTGISTATGANANQVAAFTAGKAVAFKGTIDWASTAGLTLPFLAPEMLNVKVWVLFKKSDCNMSCIRLKMDNFLVWANTRLDAERTGIQLRASVTGGDWISDQTGSPELPMVQPFVDFSESGTDCNNVLASVPPSMKQSDALNIYLIKTVGGVKHRGVFCKEALVPEGPSPPPGFANAFVASQASNSTILHELSHNLGLTQHPSPFNIMNHLNDDGVFYTEGQIFRMNFSNTSAMTVDTVFGLHKSDKKNCDSAFPNEGCPAAEAWIWPDP